MVQAMKTPAARRRSTENDLVETRPITGPRPPLEAGASENPVRRMHDEIEHRMSRSGEPRWSARRTLAFLFITNGLFWVGLALVVRAVV